MNLKIKQFVIVKTYWFISLIKIHLKKFESMNN